jgi:lipopolysaccharide export system protein LptA
LVLTGVRLCCATKWRVNPSGVKKNLLLFFSLFLFFGLESNAQEQQTREIEIVRAGSLEGSKEGGKELRRLTDDVVFKQGDTYLYCDSALFYVEDNSIDAFGHVRIESPRAKLNGDVLHYEGNTEKAVVTGKVVKLTDDKAVLITTALDYDLKNDIGYYSTGGTVTDPQNVLTSRRGFYYTKERAVYFKDEVVLRNPKYTMKADTLRYHTPSATAYFLGPCTITSTGSDSSYIYCEYGWYNTQTEKSYFSKNAFIQSKENILRGDSLLYDRKAGIGRGFRNVSVTDTVQKMIISGNYAWLAEKENKSFVTGSAMLIKIFTADSLFMHADTLYATSDSAERKSYFAYRHVRMFKPDLQGQCDSLVYHTADSTIHFYGLPVLWNDSNQLTGAHIRLLLSGSTLHRLFLDEDAFITSREDSLRFNQVRGRDMKGYFSDNALSRIDVSGNGQTVYYVRNKKKQLTGVNRADCSDMIILTSEGTVQKITLINEPDATLYPVKEVQPGEMKLRDFAWHGRLKPQKKEDIFIWPGSR